MKVKNDYVRLVRGSVRATEIETNIQRKWHEGLELAVMTRRTVCPGATHAVDGPVGSVSLVIAGEELHELYTRLVDSEGPEGCFAGCTILPKGWCRSCDRQRSGA